MRDAIRLEFLGAEARLTLDRPAQDNALTLPDLQRLRAAIAEAAARPEVRVLRLRAEGRTFCAGRAPQPGAPASQGPQPPATAETLRARLVAPILEVYGALHALDIVSVAEVQGDAHGLGCALVSACDIALAANTARFSLPEMAKDLPPTLALSALAHKVHPKAAASLVLGLATLDAQGALGAGLVGEVLAPEALRGRADALVAQLAERHPLAIATVKRYLRAAQSPDQALHAELAASLISGAMSAIQAGKA
jgi:enoyl-CoA hydratase/carnithine racemase